MDILFAYCMNKNEKHRKIILLSKPTILFFQPHILYVFQIDITILLLSALVPAIKVSNNESQTTPQRLISLYLEKRL